MTMLVLRGRALRQFLAAATLAAALFALVTCIVEVDRYFAWTLFAATLAALFLTVLALADVRDVRWSATRAMLLALVLYALAIPAMLRTPIDGDEPFYLLITESLVHDHDLDLRNQYADLAHSQTRRTDLQPQQGDPVGPHGEQRSRHEPFLPILLMPGYAIAGLYGALATMALFGALLARATVRMFEDEGIDDRTTRALFPLIAFGPPVLFFAVRIWPEVPGAWLLVEAVRGVRQRRWRRWLPSLAMLVLLKLRFVLIAIVVAARAIASRRRVTLRQLALLAVIFAAPLAVVWISSGSATSVHSMGEVFDPGSLRNGVRGFFGLLLDGAAGLLFQAPFYLLGIAALMRWRAMPESFRIGMTSAVLYLIYLCPRPEWHGGWSPPLRYVTVFMPFLALGAAATYDRVRAFLAPIAIYTFALVVHGLAFPWRLFHIASGESVLGEWLSATLHADMSRVIPSFIRLNRAAIVAAIALVVLIVASRFLRFAPELVVPILALLIAAAFIAAREPGDVIEFEDAHVEHQGGELYPYEYQVSRFAFRGGWIVRPGDALTFRARPGASRLDYASPHGATLVVDGERVTLAPTGDAHYGSLMLDIPRGGRITMQCTGGSANLDRMVHAGR